MSFFTVLGLAALWLDLSEFKLAHNAFLSDADIESHLGLQRLLSITWLVSYIVTVIVYLRWIYLASTNCHQMSKLPLRFSTGWAMGWYFVPFANLVRPYEVMSEIWRVSVDRSNFEHIPTGAIVGWWWGMWLITAIVLQLGTMVSNRALTMESVRTGALIQSVGDILWIVTCAVAMQLIAGISANQRRQTFQPG